MGSNLTRLTLALLAVGIAFAATQVASIPFGAAQTKLSPVASKKVDYTRDIQPLLSQKCYSCHGQMCSRLACGLTCGRTPCAAAITVPSSKSATAPPAG